MESSQMGRILIEIFDTKVLHVIYPMVYIYQGNTVQNFHNLGFFGACLA